ncbi:SPOR domain-containing protein [Hazenella sp. IB182353]|uniref:SPOR domain-containing protein n=1 Tax=Polycladospora coralii TaxID=2771432 RepID=UPI001746F1B7|nr:SPOR domain-containing protein [Polycladospora coralii]MBS7529646.1 SPOR domain-containing protein [Polycladospora coralii]
MGKWSLFLSALVIFALIGSGEAKAANIETNQIKYVLQGEARLFEGSYGYRITKDHDVQLKGFGTATEGGPSWGEFEIDIMVEDDDDLLVELFAPPVRDDDPNQVDLLTFPLKEGSVPLENQSFRNISIQKESNIVWHKVIAGSFMNKENAINREKYLESKSIDAFVVQTRIGNQVWYRVQAGAFTNRQSADTRLEEIKAIGIQDAYILF